MSKEQRDNRKKQFNDEYGRREVTVIPADEKYSADVYEREELVGPYCRVSTMSGDQVESFELQKKHYEEKIEQHPNWKLVDIYADEGISATSTKKRKAFLRLIEDCKSGKVTLILAKSVTRFARNTVDCIATCRMLKGLIPPVGVLFEMENIHTLAQNSELQLNLFATLAQSESETKSLSIKWAIRNRFMKGIPRILDLYGYRREGKALFIDPEKNAVVKLIYSMFLSGHTLGEIRHTLHEYRIPSPTGQEYWSYATLTYILMNERYAGDITMQKTCVLDLFSHKAVRNDGFLPKYEIYDYHPATVSREEWAMVQTRFICQDWLDFINVTKTVVVGDNIKLHPLKIGGTPYG